MLRSKLLRGRKSVLVISDLLELPFNVISEANASLYDLFYNISVSHVLSVSYSIFSYLPVFTYSSGDIWLLITNLWVYILLWCLHMRCQYFSVFKQVDDTIWKLLLEFLILILSKWGESIELSKSMLLKLDIELVHLLLNFFDEVLSFVFHFFNDLLNSICEVSSGCL